MFYTPTSGFLFLVHWIFIIFCILQMNSNIITVLYKLWLSLSKHKNNSRTCICMCSVICRDGFRENEVTASPQFHITLPLQVKNQAQVQTFASSTFSSFLDVLLSCFVFLALTLACFLPPLVSPATVGPPAPAALALAPLAGLLELASLVLSIR